MTLDRFEERDVDDVVLARPTTPVHGPTHPGTLPVVRATVVHVQDATGRARRAAAFHAVRLPLYWARLALRAPVGLWRFILWVSDHEGRMVRATMSSANPHAGTPEAQTFVRVCAHHRETQWLRVRVAVLAAAVLVVLAVFVLPPLNGAQYTAITAAGLVVLGWFGRPEEGLASIRGTRPTRPHRP